MVTLKETDYNPWVLYNPEVAPTCDVILDAAIDASTIALIISVGTRTCCKRISSPVDVLKLFFDE